MRNDNSTKKSAKELADEINKALAALGDDDKEMSEEELLDYDAEYGYFDGNDDD